MDCASKKIVPGEVVCLLCRSDLKTEAGGSEILEEDPQRNEQLSAERRKRIPRGAFANLNIKIYEGRGLIAADVNIIGQPTSSDPYCVVSLSQEDMREKTTVKPSTLSPVWNEEFDIPVSIPNQNLLIAIIDRDLTSRDDEIGYVEIPLDRLPNGKPVTGWIPVVFYKRTLTTLEGTESIKVTQDVRIPAGAIRVSLTLDFKPESQLLAYVKGAVNAPKVPPHKVPFNINNIYGPAMMILDLGYTRLLGPIIDKVTYVLSWEDYAVSFVALVTWILAARYYEYWPSMFCFFLNLLMIRNSVISRYKTRRLAAAAPQTPPKSPIRSPTKSIIKSPILSAKKSLTGLIKSGTFTSVQPETPESPVSTMEGEIQEVTLGKFVGTMSSMMPGWIKEMIKEFQPLVRQIADFLALAFEIMDGRNWLSLPTFILFALSGIILLYVPIMHFVITIGAAVLVFSSPVADVCRGVWAYASRPAPHASIDAFGMSVEFNNGCMSKHAAARSDSAKKSL
jgi:hypothetical protein